MEVVVSSDTKLTEILHQIGICAESVLLTIDGNLVPETAIAKKGQTLDILFYKHVPPFNPQEPKGHWKKAKYKSCCKFPSVLYLPQTQKHLCKNHFFRLFEKRVKKTIRTNKMLNKNDRIGIGLSGGKDSYALLCVLSNLQQSLPFELVALTIDEGIPGYRDKAIENTKQRCKELKIEHHIYSFQKEYNTTIMEIGKKKDNLCSYCGVLRRKILNSKARELNLNKLAIGHNLDDVAQTALLNMVRNEPLRIARFNEPLIQNQKFIPRIRPFRDIREKEVAAYAFLRGHQYNSGCCCPFSKNSLRRSIRYKLDSLEDEYPGTKTRIASSFDVFQKLARDSIKEKKIKFCNECGEPSSTEQCMSCKMLSALICP
ncbi:TIGR00269 family protein [Candidatus Micrarchaeota archaeon]|nr:TIGR00269 family protein [Candidatus Micrarchaeota archaeon]